MKKFSKILGAICIIVLLLTAFLFLISKFYYKRSVQATLAEYYLRLTIKHLSGDELSEKLKEKKALPEEAYQLPEKLKIKGGVEMKNFHSMPVLTMNQAGKGGTLVYLHGGSYLHEPDPHHFSFLDKLIEKSDVKVIFPVYPKAPKHDFLETYDLLTKLYREIDEKVVFMGDSAGGGLAFGFAMYLNKEHLEPPKGIIALSPWIDLTMENPEIETYQKVDPWLRRIPTNPIAKSWANGADLKDYRLSPIFGEMKNQKNITIFVGTREILYPDIIKFSKKLEAEGSQIKTVIGEGMNHVYPLFPIPEGAAAIDEIVDTLKNIK